MSDSTSPLGKGSPSILERASSPSLALSPTQTQVDQLVSHGLNEATHWKTLAAVTGAGLAYRWTRLGGLSAVSPLLSGNGSVALLARGGISGLALLSESAVFTGMNRTLQPQAAPRSFAKDWMKSTVDLGLLKGFGNLSAGQNLILRHLAADLGMVGGENLSASLGLIVQPQGSLAEQFLHAEALNLSLSAGAHLTHGLFPALGAAEKSADLLFSSPSNRGRSLPSPKLREFAFEGPQDTLDSEPKKPEPLQMSRPEEPGGPLSGPAPVARPGPAELEGVRRQFSDTLLQDLFGKGKEEALGLMTTLFLNRPELAQKYSPQNFANRDLNHRRNLFRQLIDDSQKPMERSQLNKTQIQTNFFNQAISLFVLFKDHHHAAFLAQQRQVLVQAALAAPPQVAAPAGSIPGTRPLPTEFMQPNIFVAGEKLPILPHVRGHYELGRSHFLGDSAVSLKHLFLHFHMGLWYLCDGKSTYGTYYYDENKKSWEAYRNDQWSPLQSRNILNIGNAYYRMTVMGGMVHFEPAALPPGVEPNLIRRFTSVTWDSQPFRVELNTTPQGESGGVRIGNIHFLFQRGKSYAFNLGEANDLGHNGIAVPPALDPNTGQINPSARREIRNGDRLSYGGQSYQVRIHESGDVELYRMSSWATLVPRSPAIEPEPAYNWAATGEPTAEGEVLRMNGALVLFVGLNGKKGEFKNIQNPQGIYNYSIDKKPWFRSPQWVRIQKHPANERFEVTNLGLSEGISIQEESGRTTAIPLGRIGYIKAGDKILFKGRQLIVIP